LRQQFPSTVVAEDHALNLKRVDPGRVVAEDHALNLKRVDPGRRQCPSEIMQRCQIISKHIEVKPFAGENHAQSKT
jgi:hypothetical protein